MNAPPAPIVPAHEHALAHCNRYIEWYQRVKDNARRLDYVLQTAIIGLSAVTPLLILIESLPPVLKALPATLAAIAAGLQGVFKFRERYLGFAMAGELLKAEKLRFELRMAALDPASTAYFEEVDRFAERMNRIVLTETEEWKRHFATQTKQDGSQSSNVSQRTTLSPPKKSG
jgi:hypothetical protein